MKIKQVIVVMITAALLLLAPSTANAINLAPTKKFSNCAALNRVYPGGVAKSSSVRNRGGTTKYAPRVSSKIYNENKTKDRDKDGIVCER